MIAEGTHEMLTYVTLGGEVIDLDDLTPEQRAFLKRCRSEYEANTDWLEFSALAQGPENPLVRAGGHVTPEVAAHPLYRAVWDLEMRLGTRQAEVVAGPADDPASAPFLERAVSRAAHPNPAS